MPDPRKRLIVVGDRVLIAPEEGEDRTKVGLYLPATAIDKQAVQGGKVVGLVPAQGYLVAFQAHRFFLLKDLPVFDHLIEHQIK